DSVVGASQELREDPPAVGGRAARRDDPPHPRRGVRELVVRGLSPAHGRRLIDFVGGAVLVAIRCRFVTSGDNSCAFHLLLALTSVTCKARVRAAACVTRAKCRRFSMAVTRTPRR